MSNLRKYTVDECVAAWQSEVQAWIDSGGFAAEMAAAEAYQRAIAEDYERAKAAEREP